MIMNNYIDSLGIDTDKAETLKTAIRKDSFYRNILYKAGIAPGAIDPIMRMTDTISLDETQENILIEKARVEWADFIPANKKR